MGAVLSVCRSLRWPCPLRCRYVFGPSERCSLLDVVHVEHRQASGPRQRGLAQSLFLVPLFPVPCSLLQAMGCRETFARLSRMPSRRRRHLPYVLDLQPRQIGRASCRGRVCPYVSISVVAVSLKQPTTSANMRPSTLTHTLKQQ